MDEAHDISMIHVRINESCHATYPTVMRVSAELSTFTKLLAFPVPVSIYIYLNVRNVLLINVVNVRSLCR